MPPRPRVRSQPPAHIGGGPTQCAGFRLRPVRSPLLRPSRLMSSPRGTKMFQFPRLPPDPDRSPEIRSHRITGVGLPHSGILGSQLARSSPRRIVVRHALHRLFAPRHPPAALCSLTFAQRFFTRSGLPKEPSRGEIVFPRRQTQLLRSAVFKVPASRSAPTGGAARVFQGGSLKTEQWQVRFQTPQPAKAGLAPFQPGVLTPGADSVIA